MAKRIDDISWKLIKNLYLSRKVWLIELSAAALHPCATGSGYRIAINSKYPIKYSELIYIMVVSGQSLSVLIAIRII